MTLLSDIISPPHYNLWKVSYGAKLPLPDHFITNTGNELNY